ncbi:MAG: DUF445 family protein [Flavobacteriales bacterium]|nr:DUF445 family protein [Flavobacteriales bacterium]
MIYTLPFVAAVIGWFTNFLAVKMLFHPREPVNFFFFKLQGIFPKKKDVLAQRIGKLVADDLLSMRDIEEILNQPENVSQINKTIEEKLAHYLANTFPQKYPMLSFFVGDKSRDKIKEAMMVEMETMGPEVMQQAFANLENSLDIELFIKERVSKFSTDQIEKLIKGILATEFAFIEWVGAIVGFIVGVVQLLIIELGT